ncbi:MAG TPA: CdaR family protein [Terriglobales bacterium]|jgi:YbbR domain-containing protein|nr:CdaR family protein [Terriglobales bacterium]
MSTRDFFRRHIFHNLTLKLTSLLLAAGFWLAVSSSPPSEVALNVPIIFRNMPANLEISSENLPSAQIRVRGPEAIVRRLQAADVSAEIDVTDIKPGERTFDLTHQIHVPDRLTIAQVVPSEIHVSFDARATRSVRVEARFIGEAPPGYKPKFQYDPAAVEITGPQKQVSTVQVATTDPVDITGVVGSLSVARHAYVSDPLIQVSSPRSVRITVTMEPENSPSKTQPQ